MRKHRVLLLWTCFFLILIVLTQWISFNGLYGQDSHEYYRFSQQLQELLLTGQPAGTFFYPVFYPFLGALIEFLIPGVGAMQLISMLSFFFSGWILIRILEIQFKKEGNIQALYISLLFLLSPFVLRSSLVVMSDCLALCLIVLSISQFQKYSKDRKTIYLLGFGIFSGLAITTRYVALIVLILPLLGIIQMLFRDRKWRKFIFLGAVIGIAILPQVLIKGISTHGILDHPLLQEWSFNNFLSSEFVSSEGHLIYTMPNLIYPLYTIFHPGFIVVGLPLLFFIRRDDISSYSQKIILGMFLLYAIFLAGVPFQNTRFLLLAFPMVVLLLFPAFERAVECLKSISQAFLNPIILLVLLLQMGLATRAIYPFWKMNRTEQNIAAVIKKLPKGQLYTFGMDVPLKTYGVQIPMRNLRHGSIDDAKAGDYVLFNKDKFEEQWEGKSVMKNWGVLNERFEFIKIRELDQNWILYELR